MTSSRWPKAPESACNDPCRLGSGRGVARYLIPFHSPPLHFSFRKHRKHQPPSSQDRQRLCPRPPSPPLCPNLSFCLSPSGPQENLRAKCRCFQGSLVPIPSALLPSRSIAVCELRMWALCHDLTRGKISQHPPHAGHSGLTGCEGSSINQIRSRGTSDVIRRRIHRAATLTKSMSANAEPLHLRFPTLRLSRSTACPHYLCPTVAS